MGYGGDVHVPLPEWRVPVPRRPDSLRRRMCERADRREQLRWMRSPVRCGNVHGGDLSVRSLRVSGWNAAMQFEQRLKHDEFLRAGLPGVPLTQRG